MAEANDPASHPCNDVDPIEDPEEYWNLHRILKGVNEEGTHAEWYSREAVDLEKDLGKWLKGSRDRQKFHGTFLMMAPVDHCIKKGKNQYHFFVGPNVLYEGTSHNPDEVENKTFYDAMAFAAQLMSQYGRVWTNDIWQKVQDTDPEAYPLVCEQEFRSPVLCIFQAEGHKFCFGFKEDINEYGTFREGAKINKSLGKHKRKGWEKQRARHVNYCFSEESKALKKGEIPGLAISFEKKGVAKNFTQAEELSGPNLEEWVTSHVATLDH